MNLEDIKLDIKYFFEDHGKKVLVALLPLVAIGLYLLVNREDSGGSMDESSKYATMSIEKQLDEYDSRIVQVRDNFSLYSEVNHGVSENAVGMVIDLHVKKPYTDEDTMKEHLRELIELYKLKYNENKKQFLAGVKVNMYLRELSYLEGNTPDYIATYQMSNFTKETEKLIKENEKSGLIGQIDYKWEQTLNQTKIPDYSKYTLTTDYEPLISNIVPLSNEEYVFYNKLLKYEALAGNFSGGVQLYVLWEHGYKLNVDRDWLVLNQFKDFAQRGREIYGTPKDNPYEENIYLFEQRMVNTNPVLYVYSKYGELTGSTLEARQYLIKRDKDKYYDIIVEEYERRIEDGEELESDKEELNNLINEIGLDEEE